MEESKKKWYEDFFKNPYNLLLIFILILALVIRLNYFNDNQAVWWDEAEYLLQAKHWAFGTPNTGFGEVRPILLSFILSIFYRLGGSEITARILILIFSILGVYLAYLIGKEMFNEETGLITAFLLSVFYLEVFHTIRVLVDTPATTMILLVLFLFWKGYYKDKRYLYWFGLAFALGLMMRFTTGLYALTLLIYLLITERFRFLKIKELWIAVVIALATLIPFFIWSYRQYGHPLRPILRSGGDGLKYSIEKGFGEAIGRLTTYVTQSPLYFKTVLLILIIIGILSFYKLIVGFDLLIKRKDPSLNKYLFLILWILTPLIYFSFFFHVFDVRYQLSGFPALFIIAAMGTIVIFNSLKKYNKHLALALVIILLLTVGYQQTIFTKQVVDSRSLSYVQFKYAGEWLKERTNKDDVIFNTGVPQNTYYTERETFGHGKEESFNERLKNGRIKYFVLSRLELAPDWAYSYPQRNPEKLRTVYGCDNVICTEDLNSIDPNQIVLIIYEFIDV
jgi:4-amino-4-deoxy-L-arabinose transferase-like glycosyltransferase